MDMRMIPFDFNGLKKPLTRALNEWAHDNGDKLPCCLYRAGEDLEETVSPLLSQHTVNFVSAEPVPRHPRYYARKDPETGEVTFPFWGDCGKGVRRQDMPPVFLAVPVFALLNGPDLLFTPILIDSACPGKKAHE